MKNISILRVTFSLNLELISEGFYSLIIKLLLHIVFIFILYLFFLHIHLVLLLLLLLLQLKHQLNQMKKNIPCCPSILDANSLW
jgi:hypothetical protein